MGYLYGQKEKSVTKYIFFYRILVYEQLQELVSIEALRSKLRRIFDSQGILPFGIRSLTPQQATGNALATEFKILLMQRLSY